MIIWHQFLLYIIILEDKVMVSSFQLSRPTLKKHSYIWNKILKLKTNLDSSEAVIMKT